jgi:hypothetical protein
VPGPNWVLLALAPLACFLSAVGKGGVLAYVGLGPGQEFIPYFLGLLAWAGAAFLAILQWPIVALFRRLSKRGNKPAPPNETAGANPQESPPDGRADRQ